MCPLTMNKKVRKIKELTLAIKRWEPGHAPYAAWLKTLTQEEYEAHLLQRRKRKAMRKSMEEVVQQQQKIWLSELNNTAAALLAKAKEDGDVAAFVAVWDRIVGKPKDEVQATVDTALPWNEDLD